MTDDFDELPEFEEEPQRPRDSKIDEAKAALMDRYLGSGEVVFYARQLEIWLEGQFFHWITARALAELHKEGWIQRSVEAIGKNSANFYYPKKYRYARRRIRESVALIAEYSKPTFTRALGHHGEMLVESGFARTGFRILAQKVRTVDGVTWLESNHDLDFLIERDGIRYGVEVKNTLSYIDLTEFKIKLQMSQHFGIKPMFVCRSMPTNYFNDVYQAGGYTLLTDNQNYPLLGDDLARRVRSSLNLPVSVIQRFPDTALNRFERFHNKHRGRP